MLRSLRNFTFIVAYWLLFMGFAYLLVLSAHVLTVFMEPTVRLGYQLQDVIVGLSGLAVYGTGFCLAGLAAALVTKLMGGDDK